MKNELSLTIKATKNNNHVIILAIEHGKFSEGNFSGDYYTDGATMLFNLSDGQQYSVMVKDILTSLKENLEYKKDPSGHYEKVNGKWQPKAQ